MAEVVNQARVAEVSSPARKYTLLSHSIRIYIILNTTNGHSLTVLCCRKVRDYLMQGCLCYMWPLHRHRRIK